MRDFLASDPAYLGDFGSDAAVLSLESFEPGFGHRRARARLL